MKYLLERNAWDKEFVTKHCNFRGPGSPQTLMGEPISLEQYQSSVAEYTVEKVAKISGLSVEQLRLLGDVFADKNKKITSLWCMGMNQHTQGTAINNLVHAIHLLSGHWGKIGDGPQSLCLRRKYGHSKPPDAFDLDGQIGGRGAAAGGERAFAAARCTEQIGEIIASDEGHAGEITGRCAGIYGSGSAERARPECIMHPLPAPSTPSSC